LLGTRPDGGESSRLKTGIVPTSLRSKRIGERRLPRRS